MNKFIKKACSSLVSLAMLASMGTIALADADTVEITKVEVIQDSQTVGTYTNLDTDSIALTSNQLLKVYMKTVNANENPAITFLSYKSGDNVSYDNTTVQYVAQEDTTTGTEKSVTFRPRTTIATGEYVAKVGATGVATPATFNYTVNATLAGTSVSAYSFAANKPGDVEINLTSDREFPTTLPTFTASILGSADDAEEKTVNCSVTTVEGKTVLKIAKDQLVNLDKGTYSVKISADGYATTTVANAFSVVDNAYVVTFTTGTEETIDGNFGPSNFGNSLPTPTTKANFTFGGWYDNNDTGYATKIEKYSENLDGKTLVAKWDEIPHTITYSGIPTETNTEGWTKSFNQSTGLAQLPEVPAKLGYIANGWKLGDNIVTEIVAGIASDVTLVADYTARTYTIKYNVMGATGEINDATYTYDSAFTLPDGTGLTGPEGTPNFGGWYTENTLENPVTDIKSLITSENENTAEFTLFAKWSATVMITYTFMNGETEVKKVTKEQSSVLDNSINGDVPQVQGYDKDGYAYAFMGWSEDQNTTTTVDFNQDTYRTMTENKTFYAVFNSSPIPYRVTFSNATVSACANNQTDYTVLTENKELPQPDERAGWTFDGWYTTSDYTGEKVENWSLELGTTTLYAKWVEKWDKIDFLATTYGNFMKMEKREGVYKLTKTATGESEFTNVILVSALYNADGTLKSVNAVKGSEAGENDYISIEMKAAEQDETAKVYAWVNPITPIIDVQTAK